MQLRAGVRHYRDRFIIFHSVHRGAREREARPVRRPSGGRREAVGRQATPAMVAVLSNMAARLEPGQAADFLPEVK